MIRTLSDEMRETFGGKVYKLALDGGFTCPNRDGTCGTSGCIFCLGGSGAFAERKTDDVWEQIERAKALVEKKNPSGRYIAYFQSYTATYAPLEKLEALFSRAISHPDIVGLSVATRPDCLPDDVIALLRRLNEQKPVWVELGLQTTDEKTAAYIRRGYPLSVYDDAVSRLKAAGLTVIVHLILGLPGESIETMAQSARYVGKSGADGVKLQLLHVLRGTDLEKDYDAGLFDTLSLSEYIEALEECIHYLPPSVTIHRLTGDGDKKYLVAPLWSADKKRVLGAIQKAFERDHLVQGEKL